MTTVVIHTFVINLEYQLTYQFEVLNCKYTGML